MSAVSTLQNALNKDGVQEEIRDTVQRAPA